MNALRLFVGILCGNKTGAIFFVPPIFFPRGKVVVFAGRFQNRGNLRNRGQFPSLYKVALKSETETLKVKKKTNYDLNALLLS